MKTKGKSHDQAQMWEGGVLFPSFSSKAGATFFSLNNGGIGLLIDWRCLWRGMIYHHCIYPNRPNSSRPRLVRALE